jgi:hypothetical protein
MTQMRANEGQTRARLLIAAKLTLGSGYIEEVKVWSVPVTDKYPEGIRFRLVLVDRRTGDIALLHDNHWPKGPHAHAGGAETRYRFRGVEQLLMDFQAHVARIEEMVR